MNKFIIVLIACIPLVIAGCGTNKSETSNKKTKPNIIYILADDLGYGDLGCYGQKEIKTPNLDNMAAEGVRFTRHYSGSTVCAPSRAVLMSGLHTGNVKIRGNQPTVEMDSTDITLANVLKSVGYKTAAIGKWSLGDEGTTGIPSKLGFDHFFGYLNQIRAHNFYIDYLHRNNEKVYLGNDVFYADKGYAVGVGTASRNKKVYTHESMEWKCLITEFTHRKIGQMHKKAWQL